MLLKFSIPLIFSRKHRKLTSLLQYRVNVFSSDTINYSRSIPFSALEKSKEKVIIITEDIPIKHKFTLQALNVNDVVTMYGVPVGIATKPIAEGALIHTNNIKHNAAPYKYRQANYKYEKPFTNGLAEKTFLGYHRNDGQVGTANYWIFIPMVFCQNRNLKVLREAFEAELGFKKENPYRLKLRRLVNGLPHDDYEEEKLNQKEKTRHSSINI